MPPQKRNRDNLIRTDEVATDFKLQQFLEDVQKFTERSKKNNENVKRSRKPVDDGKQTCHKRGLFENGFRSKPFLKENKARLKSNLNDLVKECAKTVESEENLSSNSQSTSERSHELENQEVDRNNNVALSGNENATDENERLSASDTPQKASNSLLRTIKDTNELQELLWEKYCERMKCTQSLAKIFPVTDHLKIAQQRINEMIYQTFLQNAKRYPSILQRIFSNDEIKRLAEVVVKDKNDKCVQTDFIVSDSFTNNVQCEMSTTKANTQPLLQSSQNSCDNQKESENFFDFNPPNKCDTRVNFLESLENQPDIYSPGVQCTSPDCNVTPPPSPLPAHIRECWAPSTLSTPRKPEIFSPNISQLQPSFKKPSVSPPEPLVTNQPNMTRYRRRRKTSQLKFIQNMSIVDSPQLCFPKRKRFAYSPHRL